ncbi:hypothetical protein Msip34_1341 [Methylovorus glucosotrophus SIP3-4]|uniref:Uncharacterized protein n=1 Tax=Methylovorus glucosotrophus (strain SIP3-4) TaxID=582744 RepID=C6XDG2_METGS|nr:hypothetical protein Msip34_1341 [Methylovorus glucosotrophus SIP3-4]
MNRNRNKDYPSKKQNLEHRLLIALILVFIISFVLFVLSVIFIINPEWVYQLLHS